MRRSHWTKGMVGLLALTMSLALVSCSDDDTAPTLTQPEYPEDAIVAQRVATAPSDDATVDALWADVEGIDIATVVPPYDIEQGGEDIWWNDYEGTSIDVNMKSVFTDTDIYFLFTWNDEEDSKLRQAWYCDIDSGTWLQMGKKHPDQFGRDPAYEDKFTMFWNMSIENFATTGCAPLCHGAYMGANDAGDKADIWHWKRDRTGPVSQVDDKYLDSAHPSGRHSDPGTGAYSDNKQSLDTSGSGTVIAPLYWIPGRTDYHWIMQSEIDDGTARMIVDMNVDGNWVDEDGTVLDQTLFEYDSDLVIPSLRGIKPGTGSRGDVSAWHNWSDGTWTLKIKRARDTGDTDNDVQFTELGIPYWFSIGVMDAAAIAHATPGGHAGSASQLILSE